ncbi:polysaccharide deacetylase family protein [Actinomadura macrotermitis]|uniref:Secreted protein n=1 Tax=Actinomadura macrotermitis TaxID=2585200 RepID=A0A7K0BZ22_9ACTN|nr:hypothetical protein [Actinomadura macrotermitis]MQY06420.1 hypothetical protein [Actinomadura macrotermitis]
MTAMAAKAAGGVAAGAALVAALAYQCGTFHAHEAASDRPAGAAQPKAAPVRLIGDGSMADTGPQPNTFRAARLAPGQRPPQFVVFSWDGAGEDSNRLFSRFRSLGARYGATQTFFLSGLYVLPESQRRRYRPPGRPAGASSISYLSTASVRRTLDELRAAWLEGNEIGTHFNGHFCGPSGVGSWSPAQWRSEIRQAKWLVANWKTTTGWTAQPPLPFDYGKELIGGRAPCLEGRANLVRAAREMGFRYDSSGVGRQVWPGKRGGLWDVPMQIVPMPGRHMEVLSMDYNFLANQSRSPRARPANEKQMREGLMRGFRRAYDGNRAPLIIGNHFEDWNGGIYMRAVADVMRDVCSTPEVQCVSFRNLVDWLDAQDPAVLRELRGLDVGERPERGWPGAMRSADS